jgi:hypothetical protein
MSCDKLVFDLSQEVEGSPNVFIRKDWINILDNQNQNYQNNQSIIDTSQLANSNKYMSYRESYLAVPMLLSMRTAPSDGAQVTPGDFSIGLKNWFGNIIHSITLDYNGTTIVQQTPFCNMWNSFKLLTSLSWSDVMTQGSTIGFYPDTPDSFKYNTVATPAGLSFSNNDFAINPNVISTLTTNKYTQYDDVTLDGGNIGPSYRTKWIAYNANAQLGNSTYANECLSNNNAGLFWKSFISNKQSSGIVANQTGILQISVMATIYLKHIHSFFNFVPLLKGVFMKLTLNLNNSRANITYTRAGETLACSSSQSYVGGIQPLLVPSTLTGNSSSIINADDGTIYYDLMVGATCYNNDILNRVLASPPAEGGKLSKSIYLYVPAYTFNPTFEQAYLSNNIKQIKYTDIYQYQVRDIYSNAQGGQFNNLITNGIANIKSVLIIPFYTEDIGGGNTALQFMSPFDTAGAGTTAQMASISNFNVQISGQNAIYNMQRYSFEEWNNQLYGQNAVNGGLTDGLTSGLIDFLGHQTSYCYYYVNVERMLPVEQSVPKSVQIIGTNFSEKMLNLWVFVEYGVQVQIDVLTGARV